jgi:hypothetical protein
VRAKMRERVDKGLARGPTGWNMDEGFSDDGSLGSPGDPKPEPC